MQVHDLTIKVFYLMINIIIYLYLLQSNIHGELDLLVVINCYAFFFIMFF
jgi:hypothetical protein